MLKQTHTYVKMELSEAAFKEIQSKMEEAGYDHAIFRDEENKLVIDMNGIAVVTKTE